MTRYFFNTQDGEAVVDVEGVELPDLAAAQINAVQLLGELLREHAVEFWKTRVYSVTVTDESGAPVILLMTAGAPMPARRHIADPQGG